MPYTYISKPVGTTYTNINPGGKTQYDQSDVTYDQATMYYDGVNPSEYTNIAKPTSTSYTNIPKPT